MHLLYLDKIIVKRWEVGIEFDPPAIFIYIANEFIVHNCLTSVEMCNFTDFVFYVFVEKAWIGSNRNSIFSRVNER